MQISLCMIAKDEEKFLGKAINSVKSIVNEIIIVDTGSKDNTKKIARKFTNKVYSFKWDDDFSAARNFAIKKATKGWILVLDADEKISKKDLKKIKKLIKNDAFTGFSLIQRTYSDKIKKLKWNSAENDSYKESKKFRGWGYRGVTRLFKNDKRIKFQYPVHETVLESIKKINGRIEQTDIPIHHYSEKKREDFLEKKSEKYIKMLKNKVKKFPKAKFYFELATELENLGKKEAEKYFKKAAKLNSYYSRFLIAKKTKA